MADFPTWNPRRTTVSKFGFGDFRIRYKALRNSSSGFGQRKDVREYLLKKYNYKCALCSSKENLQIDHITSVYMYAKEKLDLSTLNAESNLRVLCISCNARRVPNG